MEQNNKPEDDHTDERKQKEESLNSEIVALEIQVEAKRKELQELRSVSNVHERKEKNFLALYQLRFYGDTSSDDTSDSDHGTEYFECSTGDFSYINEYAEQQDSRTSEEPIAVGSQGDVNESLDLYAQPVLSSTQPKSASGSYPCLDLVIRQVDFSGDHFLLSSTTFKLAIQVPHFFEGNHVWLSWATSDPVAQPLILW